MTTTSDITKHRLQHLSAGTFPPPPFVLPENQHEVRELLREILAGRQWRYMMDDDRAINDRLEAAIHYDDDPLDYFREARIYIYGIEIRAPSLMSTTGA